MQAVAIKPVVYQNHVQNQVPPSHILIPRAAIEVLVQFLEPRIAQATRQSTKFDQEDQETFLDEFRDACRIDYGLRPSTIRRHQSHAKRLLNFLKKHPLLASRQELRRFLTADTDENAIKTLRVLYGKFLESDLASCFKVPQPVFRPSIVPTRDQIRKTYMNLGMLKSHKRPLELKAMFLLLAASGLRLHEAMELKTSQIDLEKRMIIPSHDGGGTKFQWITFYNDEAEKVLIRLIDERSPDEKIFKRATETFSRLFQKASKPTGFKITAQVLRGWFCCEMGRLGVPDRYVDAFCGRVPKKVIGKHYTDYSPERLKEIYEKANLKVL